MIEVVEEKPAGDALLLLHFRLRRNSYGLRTKAADTWWLVIALAIVAISRVDDLGGDVKQAICYRGKGYREKVSSGRMRSLG